MQRGLFLSNILRITQIRYKAEIDFDGRELARSYLAKQNMSLLLEDYREVSSEKDLENFLLKHGENIVDCMGAGEQA